MPTDPTGSSARQRRAAGSSGTNAPPSRPAAVEPEAPAPRTGLSTRTLMARLPLYQQIAEDLRQQIESGQLAPGQPVPSETELIEKYGVSRITVRAAVRDLRAAGLVITEHGRATRVRDAPRQALELDPTIHISGPTDAVAASAGRRSTRPGGPIDYVTWDSGWTLAEAPSRYRTIARGPAAVHLALPDAEPVFVTERLLTRDGATLAHTLYVPVAVCADVPGVEADPFAAPATLYAALGAAGHSLTWHDTITARMPTPDEATTLAIPTGVPLLVHDRTTHGNNGPLLHEQTRLNPQRVTLTPPVSPARHAQG
jgi:GntR family transcriptional regulator